MFDDLYPEASEAALTAKAARTPEPQPTQRFSMWGLLSAAPKGVAAGAAQGAASGADLTKAVRDKVPANVSGPLGHIPFVNAITSAMQVGADILNPAEGQFTSEVGTSLRNVAKDYTPDPTTTHVAESAVFNLFRVGSKALTAAAAGGNIPGAVIAGAEEGFSTADDLARQGVDIKTRTKVGAVTAATNAVGFALPAAGKTWAQTGILALAGGPVSFMAQNQATREILQNADYSKLADQYDPLDPLGLALSTVLPLGFGALAMRGAKAKGPMPDGSPPPDVPPVKAPDDLVDAARVTLLRENMDATNPKPGDLEAADAHSKAYKQAMEQQAEGRPVSIMDVAPKIEPIAGKATDTPNFKAWFGDSKVVDDTGAPMVVYHGTPNGGFESFNPEFSGTGIDAGYLGKGFYFTDTPKVADYYSTSSHAYSPSVMPVYLSLKNPFVWGEKTLGVRGLAMRGDSLPGDLTDAVKRRAGFTFDKNDEYDATSEQGLAAALRDELVSRGHDGVISYADGRREIVAFDPKQIKSAIGNSGKFDPNSASLTDNPIADWGAGLKKALDDMRAEFEKSKPKQPSAPPVYADTRGGPDRFHGTGKPIPALSDYYALTGDSRNIYGQGFYTTDAVDISAGYMRKGGKNPTLYKVTENDVKMYDMEAPITPEMEGILKSAMGDSYPTENYESGAPLKNLRDVYDEYRRQSSYEGLSRDDVHEVFDSIRANFEAQGYRGFSHVGGALTGKQAHAVKIFWFPESDVQIKPASIADYVQNKPQAPADTSPAATDLVALPDVASYMTSKGLKNSAPVDAAAPKGNPFISWLKSAGGVNYSQKVDIVGERGVRGNYAGIFTKKGQNLDTLVESAVQVGYLTRADVDSANDVGGTRALAELIRRATTGEKIPTVENAQASKVQDGQTRANMDAADYMERELQALGVDTAPASGNPEVLAAYLTDHREALVNRKLADIDAETTAERIQTGEAFNLTPKQIDQQSRIALANELDENAAYDAAMYARNETDYLNRIEEIIKNDPRSRTTPQGGAGTQADGSIPARDGQATAAASSAPGFNPAALATQASDLLSSGKPVAQVIGELEAGGTKVSPELQNMLVGASEFGGRINDLVDQVNTLRKQRGTNAQPFDLIAQAVENLRTGTKAEAPKLSNPLEDRLAEIEVRNPTALDAEIPVEFDDNGKPSKKVTAREYLDMVKKEAAADAQDANLIEVAANCFLSGGM